MYVCLVGTNRLLLAARRSDCIAARRAGKERKEVDGQDGGGRSRKKMRTCRS